MNKETMPVISVLMPVYNSEPYVQQAIESVLAQTYQDFEFIIINDGSTDNSETIISSFTDKRIILINNPVNLGLIATLNKGIELCRGKFIARMDADDLCLPDRFQKQVEYMMGNEALGVLGTGFGVIDEAGKVLLEDVELPQSHEDIRWAICFSNPMAHPTTMIRREALDNERYSATSVHTEDYELWTRLITKTEFHNLQEPLLQLRKHSTNVSHVFQSVQLASNIDISAKAITGLSGKQVNKEEAGTLLLQQAQDIKALTRAIDLLVSMYKKEMARKDNTALHKAYVKKDTVARIHTLLEPWISHWGAVKILFRNSFLVPLLARRILDNRFLQSKNRSYN